MRCVASAFTMLLLLVSAGSLADTNPSTAEEPQSPHWLPLSVPEQMDFGRLFSLPAERDWIDQLRQSPGMVAEQTPSPDEDGNAVPRSTQQEPDVAERVRLSGIVLRDDGRHMVWLDGRSVLSDTPPTPQAFPRFVRVPGDPVPVYYDNRFERLKPGQVWLVNEQRVVEGYAAGAEVRAVTGQGSSDQTTESTDLSGDD